MKRRVLLALPVFGVLAAGAMAFALSRNPAEKVEREPITAAYPEGPLSHGGKLYFAEMTADRVSVVEDGVARPFFRQRGCGPTAIAPYLEGYLVLCHAGRRVVSVTAAGKETGRWSADAAGDALRGPNDASADGAGGVYFSDPGVFARDAEPDGRVMHLAADGRLVVAADGMRYPNGVHVDQRRGHVYVSEHMAAQVLRFEVGPGPSLAQRATFARISPNEQSEAGPDGLELAPNGDLYVAIYGEGRVARFAQSGQHVGDVLLPTAFATNITFLADGTVVTTGAFSNAGRELAGEVRFHAPE